MATDKFRKLAHECDALSNDQLVELFGGAIVISTGQTTRQIMAAIGPVPKRTAAALAALEATVIAYRKGTLDVRADILSSYACSACALGKFPSFLAPFSITKDVPFNLAPANIYGGTYLGLGDAGCKTARWEVRIVASGGLPANAVVVASGVGVTATVLAIDASVGAVVLTTAQWAALGSPVAVDIYLRAYACADLSYKEDFVSAMMV